MCLACAFLSGTKALLVSSNHTTSNEKQNHVHLGGSSSSRNNDNSIMDTKSHRGSAELQENHPRSHRFTDELLGS